jgi:hypothetical protein
VGTVRGAPAEGIYPKAGELKPAWGYIGISFLQSDNIPAQDKWVVSVLGILNLLEIPLRLLLGSRIKVCPFVMNDGLEALVFLLQNLSLTACRGCDFGLDCLLNQHLNLALSLDIFTDGIIGDIPRRRDEITVSPEGWELEKLGKLTPEIVGTAPLECLYQLVNHHLGIAGDEQMKVVWLYLQSQYINPLFLCHLLENFHKPLFDFIYQHLASPLRTPDDMIVYQIDLICRMLILHNVYIVLLINTSVNTEKGGMPHSSPALKCGAF